MKVLQGESDPDSFHTYLPALITKVFTYLILDVEKFSFMVLTPFELADDISELSGYISDLQLIVLWWYNRKRHFDFIE